VTVERLDLLLDDFFRIQGIFFSLHQTQVVTRAGFGCELRRSLLGRLFARGDEDKAQLHRVAVDFVDLERKEKTAMLELILWASKT
jgi:hypothetical protein